MASILRDVPEPPIRVNPELQPQLGRIIGKALEKDRDLRCQSAAELRRTQPVPLLLEVDSDREKCPEQMLLRRRQQFYRRQGCLTVSGLHYYMPFVGEGPPPEMDLLIYPSGSLRQVPKSELEGWLKTIYQSVYRCSPEDPRIRQMLMSVADPVPLV